MMSDRTGKLFGDAFERALSPKKMQGRISDAQTKEQPKQPETGEK